MSSKARPSEQPPAGFAKRVLVVDPDQKAWELGARLLIAQGCLVHRISHVKDAPPRWPRHLYDLVVVALENPPNDEALEFCRKLTLAQPPVGVALLASANANLNPPATPVISRDQTITEIAECIKRLLR